jgi:hypothetical protein
MNKILEFISHPAISQAWLAEKLYGDKSSKNCKKISLKVSGKQQFNDSEVSKLKEIKKEFIKKIR